MNKNDKEFIAAKIRTQYIEKGVSDIDELRKLDVKAKRPANIFAWVFGSISALIMGCGMSLIMTDIATVVGIPNPMVYGIIIGVLGMAMAAVNYPIYKGIMKCRKEKFAEEIIKKSENILNK